MAEAGPANNLYLDACATSPLAPEALQAMQDAWQHAWGNPSSLHPHGLAAAERLERSRMELAIDLGAEPGEVMWCSGGTEAIQTALLGSAETLEPGRLLISAVEHPATVMAAAQLARKGWQVERLPVDRQGLLCLEQLMPLLEPPTRMVSLIWGQSEVGSVQPITTVGNLCRQRGIRLHVDAVQVLGHARIDWGKLPVDLLSGAAHKLQGPRGIGVLLVRQGLPLQPLISGVQEGGRRGGTEPVALAAGFAAALRVCQRRLEAHGGLDPLAIGRNGLWAALQTLPGVEILGPDPADDLHRLPHHLSLMVRTRQGRPIPGRSLVRALARRGLACSSGAACSARRQALPGQDPIPVGASPVLTAMGYGAEEALAGLRLSLGPWLQAKDLAVVPPMIEQAIGEVESTVTEGLG
ncbi:MAG: cysteine desulfurase family protein [Cyanobacteriota bacterium]|nr:cysteine desulfurase family protein [Cyanobacteriota bacterium]